MDGGDHRRSVRPKPVSYNRSRSAVTLHRALHELQGRPAIPALRRENLTKSGDSPTSWRQSCLGFKTATFKIAKERCPTTCGSSSAPLHGGSLAVVEFARPSQNCQVAEPSIPISWRAWTFRRARMHPGTMAGAPRNPYQVPGCQGAILPPACHPNHPTTRASTSRGPR